MHSYAGILCMHNFENKSCRVDGHKLTQGTRLKFVFVYIYLYIIGMALFTDGKGAD